MKSIPCIQTDRLRLRAISESDCEGVLQIFSDSLVVEHYDIAPISDRAAALRLIEGFDAWFKMGEAIRWGIWHQDLDQLVGTCCFDQIHLNFRRVNLGYNLLSQFWGAGYAFEACQAIISWAFENGLEAPINRIQAITVPENVRSEKLLNRLGFQREGLLREFGFWDGHPRDMNIFGLIKSDWKSHSKAENDGQQHR